MRRLKGHKGKSFPFFIQTGKMLIPGDFDMLHIYNVIPSTTTKSCMKRDTQNITDIFFLILKSA